MFQARHSRADRRRVHAALPTLVPLPELRAGRQHARSPGSRRSEPSRRRGLLRVAAEALRKSPARRRRRQHPVTSRALHGRRPAAGHPVRVRRPAGGVRRPWLDGLARRACCEGHGRGRHATDTFPGEATRLMSADAMVGDEEDALQVPIKYSVPELANLGGKQHPTDIIFPLFPSNFTTDFPLSSTEKIIMCND